MTIRSEDRNRVAADMAASGWAAYCAAASTLRQQQAPFSTTTVKPLESTQDAGSRH